MSIQTDQKGLIRVEISRLFQEHLIKVFIAGVYGYRIFNLVVCGYFDIPYHIEQKGLDHLCEGCVVAPINQQSGNREGDQDDQAKQESQGAGNAGGDGEVRQPTYSDAGGWDRSASRGDSQSIKHIETGDFYEGDRDG
jgi:hypothetical protein